MTIAKTANTVLSIMVCLSLLLILASCEKAREDAPVRSMTLKTGMPIVSNPITLKVFSPYPPNVSSDWDSLKLWQEYEKMSGIHVEWDLVQVQNLVEKRNLLLSGSHYPDIFYASQLSVFDLMKYGGTGVFIPLNSYLDQYAPNFKRLLDRNPALRKSITMTDGNIYALPTVFDPDFTSVLAVQKFWLKENWLKQLNRRPPDTTEELYSLLKAIKETDLNGNGKHDEIPLMFQELDTFLLYIRGAWGLGNRGIKHAFIDVDPVSGRLRFIPTDPKYKEVLQYAHRLYREGLFDTEMFTLSNEGFVAKAGEGNVGTFIGIGPAAFNGKGYMGGNVLSGPYGDRLYSFMQAPIVVPGSFAITSSNPYPEASLRWADYFYGDEGNTMYFMGFDNVTYRSEKDGTLAYTDEIVHNANGLNINQAIGKYLVWPGTAYPGIVRQSTFKGTEGLPEALEAADKIKTYLPQEVWSEFVYTNDEADQINALKADIDTYVHEMQIKFVSGDISFSEWDNYVETVRNMGLSQYMHIFEAAYNRYETDEQ